MKKRTKKRRESGWYWTKPRKRWRTEWNALLGTKPDQEVAKETGTTLHMVRYRRLALGIKFRVHRRRAYWRPEWDALLGTIPDSEVVRRIEAVKRMRIPLYAVSERRREIGRAAFRARQSQARTPKMLKRTQTIVALRTDGWSLQKIGTRFHITRERVRQILKNGYAAT